MRKPTFTAVLIEPLARKVQKIEAPKAELRQLLHATDKLHHTVCSIDGRDFLVLSGDTDCALPSVLDSNFEPIFYGRVLVCLDDGGGNWLDLDAADVAYILARVHRLASEGRKHGHPMLTHTERRN